MKASLGLWIVLSAVGCGAVPGAELDEAEIESVDAESTGLRTGVAVAGSFDGYLFTVPCVDGGTRFDCATSATAPSNRKVAFRMQGDAGVPYTVRVRVRGIAEGKRYIGGTRADPNPEVNDDTGGNYLYTGGTIPSSLYNSYSLEVSPAVPGAASVFRLNSIMGSESHSTYLLDYTFNIRVLGNGLITLKLADPNSRQMMNCGDGMGGTACTESRSIYLGDASPRPPASFVQPYGAPTPGQWLHFDVRSVTRG